jgi:hypothetical protein
VTLCVRCVCVVCVTLCVCAWFVECTHCWWGSFVVSECGRQVVTRKWVVLLVRSEVGGVSWL